MGFLDFLTGTPKYKLLPGVSDSINGLNGLNFGIGKAAKSSQRLLKHLDAGDDVSDIGTFSPIRQEEAADLSDIDMDYSTGANVLNAAGGGEQANQINAMRDRAKENRRAQTGRQMVGALGSLRQGALDTLDRATGRRDAEELQRQQLLLQARGSQYNSTGTGGLLGSLISGGAQVAGAYLGGKPCWIAKSIWGKNDPRVDIVRSYLLDWDQRSLMGAFVVWLYRKYGERIAKQKWAVRCLKPLFNHWLKKAMINWNVSSRLNGSYSISVTAYRQSTSATLE